jgi:hypothetical protein|tara:strand:- start:1199 stop:2101 length:903 start_codon:yes stop_codon:yes gene_type:complete
MRIVISIFCLPYEIDELENTLNQLKKASYYVDNKIEWVLDVTLCTSDEMVNWKKSSISKEYFTQKLLKLSSNTDWCTKYFKTSDTILGCVSQRRGSLEQFPDADYYIWLDTDIIFDERTLYYFQQVIENTNEEFPLSVITPEIVRIWDNSWDCIVNEKFLEEPLDYQKTNDPYKDSGIKGDISVETVSNISPINGNNIRFKFAGGWFTCISGALLNRVGIPQSFGHYGFEDTFLMVASEKLIQQSNESISQFKIKNLVVCENYKYRNNSHYLNHISVYDRREEFKAIAQSNFGEELQKIQ